jgi:hypothetical protein
MVYITLAIIATIILLAYWRLGATTAILMCIAMVPVFLNYSLWLQILIGLGCWFLDITVGETFRQAWKDHKKI